MLLDGCHEGKHTPRLSEVKCPKCGQWVDIWAVDLVRQAPWLLMKNASAVMCCQPAVTKAIMSSDLQKWKRKLRKIPFSCSTCLLKTNHETIKERKWNNHFLFLL